MPVDRKTTNRGILTKNFRRLTDRLYRIHREPNGYAPDRWTDLRRSRKSHRRDADSDEPGLYRGLVGGSSTCKYQSVGTRKPRHSHKQAVPNTMRSSSVPIALSIFGVST